MQGLFTSISPFCICKKKKLYLYCSGWVRTIFYHDLGTDNPNCVLKGTVNPSQRLSSKPHEAWVAVQKSSGIVTTGHCTCMAG